MRLNCFKAKAMVKKKDVQQRLPLPLSIFLNHAKALSYGL
jgi:hypothetical protein